MGQIRPVTFWIAIFLFICVSLLVYAKPKGMATEKIQQLSSAFSGISDWQVTGQVPLQDEIVDSLELDDYLYQNYRNRDQTVSLYIGYYLTGGKVGAAHDPLVCLPGQGWLVRERGRGELKLDEQSDGRSISYSTMLVERNGEFEYFLYWFQTYDKAVADTFSQKIVTLTNKFKGLGQDNAFVRLNCSLNGRDEQKCHQALVNFMDDFYPAFLEYVQDGK